MAAWQILVAVHQSQIFNTWENFKMFPEIGNLILSYKYYQRKQSIENL